MEYEYITDDAVWKKKNVERISKRRPQTGRRYGILLINVCSGFEMNNFDNRS